MMAPPRGPRRPRLTALVAALALLTPTTAAAQDPSPAPTVPAVPAVPAELSLLRRDVRGVGCRLSLKLENKLPYPINNLVPFFSAIRPDGVVYQTMSTSFMGLRPGDSQVRTVDFTGIVCDDIGRVQVQGGDRCDMAELDRFTEGKGLCLARVKVLPSSLMRFEK